MKKNRSNIFSILLVAVLCVVFAGSACAGPTTDKGSNYETVDGVLSIKEGHGEFLVRLPDGKSQRFSVNVGGGAEITRNGQTARYSELKPSDSIQVKYDTSNRKVISIHASGS